MIMTPYFRSYSSPYSFLRPETGSTGSGNAESAFGELSAISSVNGRKQDYHAHTYTKRVARYAYGSFEESYLASTPVRYGTHLGAWAGTRLVNLVLDRNRYAGLADRKALSRFYKQLRDSELNISVDVAEMNKTGKMISGMADRMVELARAVRGKHRFKNDKDPHKDISNAWLEYQYGVKPLLNTIYQGTTFLANKAKRFRVSVTGKFIDELQGTTNIAYGLVNGLVREHISCRTKYVVDFQISNSAVFNASRIAKFNPIALAWELVPYSFVADWAFDLGSYLEDLETSFGLGLTFVRGFKTQTYRHVCTVRVPIQYNKSGSQAFRVHQDLIPGFSKVTGLNRSVLGAIPTPYAPSFDVKLGADRLMSAAALIGQLLNFGEVRTRKSTFIYR